VSQNRGGEGEKEGKNRERKREIKGGAYTCI